MIMCRAVCTTLFVNHTASAVLVDVAEEHEVNRANSTGSMALRISANSGSSEAEELSKNWCMAKTTHGVRVRFTADKSLSSHVSF